MVYDIVDEAGKCMDGEILQTGTGIVELLKRQLSPQIIRDADAIALASPWEDKDYRLGVYLYDIRSCPVTLPYEQGRGGKYVSGGVQKAVELCYMIFCNASGNFGEIRQDELHGMLNEVIRTICANPVLELEKHEKLQIFMSNEDVDFKVRLWGGFQLPLRPAVYVHAVPVVIAQETGYVPEPVRAAEYNVSAKENRTK